jgi:acyl-CoA thioesterase YciA
MDPKPVSESCAVLSHLMGVTDANNVGNIHGGIIMKLVDEAAGLAAIKHSGRLSVTAGMDRMNFMFPIHLGEAEMRRANRLSERAEMLAHEDELDAEGL